MKEHFSIEAEQAVLGSMLLDADALRIGVEELACDDFYRETHQIIHLALTELHDAGTPVDIITLKIKLARMVKLEEAGGQEYLFTLAESVPTAANCEHYCRIVKEFADQRERLRLALETVARFEGDDNTPEAMSESAAKFIRAADTSNDRPRRISELIPSYYDNLQDYTERQDALRWKTCLPTLDANFEMGTPRLIVVKARRGSGKTHILIDWAWHCAYHGRAALIFSLEMSERGILQRVIARSGGVNSRTVAKPWGDNDWANVLYASDQAKGLPIYISAGRGTTTARMMTIVESLKASGVDIGMIGIDYAELIGTKARNSREQELMSVAVDLQRMADRAQASVVLLSQTNKEGGERYSEGIGNSADLLLHWEREGEQATLTCEKNRFGPGFKLPCKMNYQTSTLNEETGAERGEG
jgi:replicative DNA helicase